VVATQTKREFKIQLESTGKEYIVEFKSRKALETWIAHEERFFKKKYTIKEEIEC
jgi:hypothetical protein